jgi:hypothetical protein
MEQTNLQMRMDGAGKYIAEHVTAALASGAEVKKFSNSVIVDGVLLSVGDDGKPQILVRFDCPELVKKWLQLMEEDADMEIARLQNQIDKLKKRKELLNETANH